MAHIANRSRFRITVKNRPEVLAYVLEGWLEDSGPRGVELLAQYRDELRAQGRKVREPQFRMRQPGTELGWIHKRLAEVTTVDIEGFIDERLEVVAKGTVDRDIDRLKAIFKVAMQVWDLNVLFEELGCVSCKFTAQLGDVLQVGADARCLYDTNHLSTKESSNENQPARPPCLPLPSPLGASRPRRSPRSSCRGLPRRH